MDAKVVRRQKIRYRIRKSVEGSSTKPRISVFRSNTDLYIQLIDDTTGKTLVAASTKDKEIAAQKVTKSEKAKLAGAAAARKAVALGITIAVFDRGGYLYHGRVQAAAEGAREGGLQF